MNFILEKVSLKHIYPVLFNGVVVDPDTNIIQTSEALPGEAEDLTISLPTYAPVQYHWVILQARAKANPDTAAIEIL